MAKVDKYTSMSKTGKVIKTGNRITDVEWAKDVYYIVDWHNLRWAYIKTVQPFCWNYDLAKLGKDLQENH